MIAGTLRRLIETAEQAVELLVEDEWELRPSGRSRRSPLVKFRETMHVDHTNAFMHTEGFASEPDLRVLKVDGMRAAAEWKAEVETRS